MRTQRFPAIGLLAAIPMLVLASAPALSADKKPVKIALFVAIQSNPVEQAIINAFNDVAKQDGAAEFTVFDSDNNVQKELANCNDAIASGSYDAFALKPVAGPPLMACAAKAIEAHIPVVAFGNALGPDADTAARQMDGLAASVIELAKTNGGAIADLVAAACKAKGADPCEVIYTHGPLAFDWSSISRKYFEAAVGAKYPSIKVVATEAHNFDPNLARTVTKNLVPLHAEVDVIAADADNGAIGVVAGLKDLGKAPGKDVLVTGGALSNQGKALLEAGEMFGSTCLMPQTEAKTAALYSIQAARGETID
jgi:ABC-type sugar transport system substrate-binding protein